MLLYAGSDFEYRKLSWTDSEVLETFRVY